ncbi:MAG TPA: membrane protein insertion efficiency factor YidD [Euzebyales bacterium]|nr:membrane protein insertion efficiency factor YidD [Euzebyales bacterium]
MSDRLVADEGRGNLAVQPLVLLLRLWHWLPRIDTMRCRFHPTCAEYAVTALRRFGLLRGSWLAVRRVGRCHPWNPGGVDYVPERAVRGTPIDPATAKVR